MFKLLIVLLAIKYGIRTYNYLLSFQVFGKPIFVFPRYTQRQVFRGYHQHNMHPNV